MGVGDVGWEICDIEKNKPENKPLTKTWTRGMIGLGQWERRTTEAGEEIKVCGKRREEESR